MMVTPGGVLVLLPLDVDPAGERAQAFVEAELVRLPEPQPAGEPLDREMMLSAWILDWREREWQLMVLGIITA
jgi:hypothetical protein